MSDLTYEEKKRRLDMLRKTLGWSEAEYQAHLARLRDTPNEIPTRQQPPSRRPGRVAQPISQPPDKEVPAEHCVAPYRFVTIPDHVVMPPQEVSSALGSKATLLNTPLEGGYCGEIAVEWEAETPFLIGQRAKDADPWSPMQLGKDGDYWIPGSSFRGLIRAAAEIIGHARLEQVNKSHVFALRDFKHRDYNSIEGLGLGKAGAVKAGWLWCGNTDADDDEEGKWEIEPSDLAYVEIRDLLTYVDAGHRQMDWITLGLDAKYTAVGMKSGSSFDFKKTARFNGAPNTQQDQPRVSPVKDGGLREGVLVFSGATPRQRPGSREAQNPKHFEYAFMTKPGTRTKERISKKVFQRFLMVHTTQGAKQREPVGSWATLSKIARKGAPIPVFYVGDLQSQDEKTFAFGLTRLFRVPHRLSVGDRIANTLKRHVSVGHGKYEPDFVSALFGYVHEAEQIPESQTSDFAKDSLALKGRIAFSGAVIGKNNAKPTDVIHTVNMAPRLSFAPFYLAGPEKDWSSADAPFAGRKRYLPRSTGGNQLMAIQGRLKSQIDALPEYMRAREHQQTRMQFLVPKTETPLRFSSRIRLHNVTAEEVGLVLFALTHGGNRDCRHMLGRAKPYGAGQMRVVSARLDLEANTCRGKGRLSAPSTDDQHCPVEAILPPGEDRAEDDYGYHNASHQPFLKALQDFMCGAGGVRAFPDCEPVKQFLGSSDPREGARLSREQSEAGMPLYLSLPMHGKLKRMTQLDKHYQKGAETPRPSILLPAPSSPPQAVRNFKGEN